MNNDPNIVHSEAISTIHRVRGTFAAISLGMVSIFRPEVRRQYGEGQKWTISLPTKECPSIRCGADGIVQDNGAYRLDIDSSLKLLTRNPKLVFEFLSLPAKQAILAIGHELDRLGWLDKSPEIEFFRHVRNAAAHGNRFRIDKPIQRPATFKSYVIGRTIHGRRLLPEGGEDGYLCIGDALALMEFVEMKVKAKASTC